MCIRRPRKVQLPPDVVHSPLRSSSNRLGGNQNKKHPGPLCCAGVSPPVHRPSLNCHPPAQDAARLPRVKDQLDCPLDDHPVVNAEGAVVNTAIAGGKINHSTDNAVRYHERRAADAPIHQLPVQTQIVSRCSGNLGGIIRREKVHLVIVDWIVPFCQPGALFGLVENRLACLRVMRCDRRGDSREAFGALAS